MKTSKRHAPKPEYQDLETIIARARRERDAHLRHMIGSLFGR